MAQLHAQPDDDPEIRAFLEQGLAIPPGPRCNDCSHPMCPCDAHATCHTLLWFDARGDQITDADDPRLLVDFRHCCGGHCSVNAEDMATWRASIADLLEAADATSRPLLFQHGPFFPASVARERTPSLTIVNRDRRLSSFTAAFIGTVQPR